MFLGEFFNKHKDKLPALIPTVFFVLLCCLFWGKWGNAVYDCFREVIIPSAIIEGKVLYTDITNIYPPASYQINALFVFIFKNGLNTFYMLGILASFLILACFYKTVKERSSNLTALAVIISIIEIFVFRSDPYNTASWIFPYAYAFLYAFLFCIFAFYFYFDYKKTNRDKSLYLAFLMTGLSIAFKYDFALFLILPVFETLKNKSFKKFFKGTGLTLIPSVVSFLIYFISGGSIKGLFDWANFLINFSKAPSVLIFNHKVLHQTITPVVIDFAFRSFMVFAICALIFCAFLYFALFLFEKAKNKFLKGIIFVISLFIAYIMAAKTAVVENGNFAIDLNFIFVSYFVTISALIIFLLKFKKKNYTEKENFYMTASIASLIISFREIAAILISYIGNFFIIIPWFLFIYFWMEILPEYFSFFRTERTKRTIALFFVLFGLSFLLLHINSAGKMTEKIKTDKGIIYTNSKYAITVNEAVEYINKNIPSEKTVLVASEGPILNYLTNRRTNLKYYALIPHITEAYGENYITEDLKQNPPDYIFITNLKYIFIGEFGTHYAREIQEFINSNYKLVETLPKGNSTFKIAVFKKL